MTHLKTQTFWLTMTVAAAALAAGAAQAQPLDRLRQVQLCDLEQEWPLSARLTDQLFAREDFDLLLRYASRNCPNVALLLTDGATAAIPGAAPAATSAATGAGPDDDERRVLLCDLEEEWPLPQRVVNRILAREDFDELLRYSSENCPEVALLLTDSATATIPEDGATDDDDREDRDDRVNDTLPGGDDDTLPGGDDDTLPGGDDDNDSLPGGGANDSLPGGNTNPPTDLDDFLNRYN